VQLINVHGFTRCVDFLVRGGVALPPTTPPQGPLSPSRSGVHTYVRSEAGGNTQRYHSHARPLASPFPLTHTHAAHALSRTLPYNRDIDFVETVEHFLLRPVRYKSSTWRNSCARRFSARRSRSPAGPSKTEGARLSPRRGDQVLKDMRLTDTRRYSDLQPVGMGAFGLVW
jgi:hypothetical protein